MSPATVAVMPVSLPVSPVRVVQLPQVGLVVQVRSLVWVQGWYCTS